MDKKIGIFDFSWSGSVSVWEVITLYPVSFSFFFFFNSVLLDFFFTWPSSNHLAISYNQTPNTADPSRCLWLLLLPRYQWSLSNTKGPAFAWLPRWPVFTRRWGLIILFRCSEPWHAAVREKGVGVEERGVGGVKGAEEGHRGTHQEQRRAEPDWGDQPFLLLPSRAFGQLSNQVTSLSRVASGQLFSSLCRSLPPLLPVPPPAAVAADVIFPFFVSMGFCLLPLARLW